PVIRRFLEQEPARNTRWVTQLYDAIDAANEVRRTMREMGRRGDQDAALELAYSPENMIYRQLQAADKRMQGFRRFAALVMEAADLAETRRLATEWARLMGRPEFLAKARRSSAWSDAGALKRLVLDAVVRQRNDYAKGVMQTVEGRRAELEAALRLTPGTASGRQEQPAAALPH